MTGFRLKYRQAISERTAIETVEIMDGTGALMVAFVVLDHESGEDLLHLLTPEQARRAADALNSAAYMAAPGRDS